MAKMTKKMKLILTVPPYARFGEFAQCPTVEAVRLNTTLPLNDPLEDILSHVKKEAGKKDIWIDLKCRQLRIKNYNVNFSRDKETHYITLSRNIEVDTPVEVWIDDGNFVAKVIEVKKRNRLVIPSSVERKTGLPLAGQGEVGIRPGMSVNILDPSLIIQGYLTRRDKEYAEAAKKLGLHNFMLSYVEQESDITDLLTIDPDAKIMAKIESKKGLEFVENIYPKYKKKLSLMAARGDGYLEVNKPDQIIDFCKEIIKADKNAVFASRMFESLRDVEKMPECRDLFDVYCGMLMGYKRFLLGDDICMKRDSVKAAIGLFGVLSKKYKRKK